jgi:hypothetical protein
MGEFVGGQIAYALEVFLQLSPVGRTFFVKIDMFKRGGCQRIMKDLLWCCSRIITRPAHETQSDEVSWRLQISYPKELVRRN